MDFTPGPLLPAASGAVLPAPSHACEVIALETPHPPQALPGNGDTSLDEPFPVPFPASAQPAPGAVVAVESGLSARAHHSLLGALLIFSALLAPPATAAALRIATE